VRGLRQVADDARGGLTKELAAEDPAAVGYAGESAPGEGLASMAYGRGLRQATLQEVATALAEALREQPAASEKWRTGGALRYARGTGPL